MPGPPSHSVRHESQPAGPGPGRAMARILVRLGRLDDGRCGVRGLTE